MTVVEAVEVYEGFRIVCLDVGANTGMPITARHGMRKHFDSCDTLAAPSNDSPDSSNRIIGEQIS